MLFEAMASVSSSSRICSVDFKHQDPKAVIVIAAASLANCGFNLTNR